MSTACALILIDKHCKTMTLMCHRSLCLSMIFFVEFCSRKFYTFPRGRADLKGQNSIFDKRHFWAFQLIKTLTWHLRMRYAKLGMKWVNETVCTQCRLFLHLCSFIIIYTRVSPITMFINDLFCRVLLEKVLRFSQREGRPGGSKIYFCKTNFCAILKCQIENFCSQKQLCKVWNGMSRWNIVNSISMIRAFIVIYVHW